MNGGGWRKRGSGSCKVSPLGPLCVDKQIHLWQRTKDSGAGTGRGQARLNVRPYLCYSFCHCVSVCVGVCWYLLPNYLIRKCLLPAHNTLYACFYCAATRWKGKPAHTHTHTPTWGQLCVRVCGVDSASSACMHCISLCVCVCVWLSLFIFCWRFSRVCVCVCVGGCLHASIAASRTPQRTRQQLPLWA